MRNLLVSSPQNTFCSDYQKETTKDREVTRDNIQSTHAADLLLPTLLTAAFLAIVSVRALGR